MIESQYVCTSFKWVQQYVYVRWMSPTICLYVRWMSPTYVCTPVSHNKRGPSASAASFRRQPWKLPTRLLKGFRKSKSVKLFVHLSYKIILLHMCFLSFEWFEPILSIYKRSIAWLAVLSRPPNALNRLRLFSGLFKE